MHTLPDLPYDFSALEPVISAQIMELHYTKHHSAYVNNLNAALEKYKEAESKGDLAGMIALEPAIRFNGGGHINHTIFWTNLSPVAKTGQGPSGHLESAIKTHFSSLDGLIEEMTKIAMGIQGSGWAWLGLKGQKLGLFTCANQDPLATQGAVPLLGIDVWEHAYYLQYKNVRLDYVKNIWKIVNWTNVGERYQAAIG